MRYIFLDFDDTIVQTNSHVLTCYNAVTTDTLKGEDFICEYTWDNLPYHKELWTQLVRAVVADPLRIPAVDGVVTFLNSLLVDSENRYIILSKRYGKNLIRHYLTSRGVKQDLINSLQYVLVSENEQKIKFIKELREHHIDRIEIHYYEDRSDVVKEASKLCNKIFILNRPWNKSLKESRTFNKHNIVFFDSYTDILGYGK